MRVSAAWLPGVPYWDAKQAIARHVLIDAHHAEALLKRLHELKATGAEHQQHSGIVALVGDLASATNGDEWLRGLYGVVKPWLIRCFEGYLQASDPVMDEPTHAILQRSIAELETQVGWFRDFCPGYSAFETADSKPWLGYVQDRLAGLDLAAGFGPGAAVPPFPAGHRPLTGIPAVHLDRTIPITEKVGFSPEKTSFVEKTFTMIA